MVVVILAAVLLLPLGASAASSALFDFDDFPDPVYAVQGDAVQTLDYGCRGRSYCSYADVRDLRDGTGVANGVLSASRGGITATFSASTLEIWPDASGLALGPGDDSGMFLWTADFDVDLVSVRLDLPSPWPATKLELWSGPGATGTLVNSATLLPGDDPLRFGLDALPGQVFRSFRAGRFYPVDPSCTYPGDPGGCPSDLPASAGSLDNVRVTAAPEAAGWLLLALGLTCTAFVKIFS